MTNPDPELGTWGGRSSKGRRDRPWGAPYDPPLRRIPGRQPDRRAEAARIGHEIREADDPRPEITAIVRRAQEGDDLAFAELYIAFFDRVKRFLVVTLKNPDDATEIAQDVFERAFKTLDRYEPERGPFRTWLFRIVSSMAIDHLRRERRKRELEPSELSPGTATLIERGAALVEHLDPGSGVRDLVDALPEAQRRAVTLRFVFDFNAAEIAEVLGTTGDAVRHLHHRALKTLSAGLTAPRPVAAAATADD